MGLSPEKIFAPCQLERSTGIIVAVSGGSDSLGLLFLISDFLKTMNQAPKLVAVTIDHQLRQEARLEAEAVAALCKRHHIDHRIYTWDEPKPKTGLAAAARTARYRLLVQAAKDAGADIIVTGHTRDDQIETFLMRKARSSHSRARGLAAMADRSRLENSVYLIRPLLDISRQALRDNLMLRGIEWVDDPSNQNANYERPRIRLSEAKDADPDLVLAQIALATASRKQDNAAIIAALAQAEALSVDSTGALLLHAEIYTALPENARRLLAGLLTSLAGGRRFLPGDAERTRIEHSLLKRDSGDKFTVFGALVQCCSEGFHKFRRERRNLPVIRLAPFSTIIWDGRYQIEYCGDEEIEIRTLDRQELTDFAKEQGIELNGVLREALLVEPAVFKNGKLECLLLLNSERYPAQNRNLLKVRRHFALFDHVLPGYDFGLAEAIEMRIGRECTDFCKSDS